MTVIKLLLPLSVDLFQFTVACEMRMQRYGVSLSSVSQFNFIRTWPLKKCWSQNIKTVVLADVFFDRQYVYGDTKLSGPKSLSPFRELFREGFTRNPQKTAKSDDQTARQK